MPGSTPFPWEIPQPTGGATPPPATPPGAPKPPITGGPQPAEPQQPQQPQQPPRRRARGPQPVERQPGAQLVGGFVPPAGAPPPVPGVHGGRPFREDVGLQQRQALS